MKARSQFDESIDLTTTPGWQKKKNGTWQDTTETPQTQNTTEEDIEYRRKLFRWGTTSAPLGNNGSHSLKVVSVDGDAEKTQLQFGGATGVGKDGGPNALTTEVGNLVITEAKASDGNLDFVRYAPDSDDSSLNNPTMTFKFEDKDFQEGDIYNWQVFFPETHYQTDPALVGTLTSVQPVTVSMPTGMKYGVYGYGIMIDKVRGNVHDAQYLRSTRRFFNNTHLEIQGSSGQCSEEALKYHYRIVKVNDDAVNPKSLSDVQIKAVDGNLEIRGSVSGDKEVLAPSNPDHIVDAPDTGDEPGEARIVSTGEDDEAEFYRAHKNKRLLPLNAAPRTYTLLFLNGPYTAEVNYDGSGADQDWSGSNLATTINNGATAITLKFDGSALRSTSTPKEIWAQIKAKADASRKKDKRFHPISVNIVSHGNVDNIDVSSVLPGNGQADNHELSRWSCVSLQNPATTQDYDIRTAPMLEIAFMHNMGCGTSGHITPYIATDKGALNSVGYRGATEYAYGPGVTNQEQLWYNYFHRIGFAPGYNTTGGDSLRIALLAYNQYIDTFWNHNSAVNGSWGYEKYKVTFPSKPLLDP